jgi:purine-binding chemotaxis protein CheW
MDRIHRYLTFFLNNTQFALPLSLIERIILIAEITPLPNAPDIIMGVINIHGRLIPIADLRLRFNFDRKPLQVEDYIIIGRTPQRPLGLRVDNVGEIFTSSKNDVVEQKNILPDISYIDGAVKMNGNIVLIHDLERCLSIYEHEKVSEAIGDLKNVKKKKRKHHGAV